MSTITFPTIKTEPPECFDYKPELNHEIGNQNGFIGNEETNLEKEMMKDTKTNLQTGQESTRVQDDNKHDNNIMLEIKVDDDSRHFCSDETQHNVPESLPDHEHR